MLSNMSAEGENYHLSQRNAIDVDIGEMEPYRLGSVEYPFLNVIRLDECKRANDLPVEKKQIICIYPSLLESDTIFYNLLIKLRSNNAQSFPSIINLDSQLKNDEPSKVKMVTSILRPLPAQRNTLIKECLLLINAHITYIYGLRGVQSYTPAFNHLQTFFKASSNIWDISSFVDYLDQGPNKGRAWLSIVNDDNEVVMLTKIVLFNLTVLATIAFKHMLILKDNNFENAKQYLNEEAGKFILGQTERKWVNAVLHYNNKTDFRFVRDMMGYLRSKIDKSPASSTPAMNLNIALNLLGQEIFIRKDIDFA